MKYQKDIGFAIIRSNTPIDKKLIKSFSIALNKNKKFFNDNVKKKFNIVICNNKIEWKKECKYYHFPEACGTVLRNGDLIIKSLQFMRNEIKEQYGALMKSSEEKPAGPSSKKWKESIENYQKRLGKWFKDSLNRTNYSSYQKSIDHEMNHVFWTLKYKTTKPIWMMEGLASIIGLARRISRKDLLKMIKQKKMKSNILVYKYKKRDFTNTEKVYFNYLIWGYFILFITKNRPNKIIEFMDEYSKKVTLNNYNNLFVKFFGDTVKTKFEEFV